MKKMINDKKTGFTLIEFIFYIGLFAVFFVSLFFVLDIFYKNKIKNRSVLEVEQQGIIISQIISQEIRNAQLINLPLLADSGDALSLSTFSPLRDPIVFQVVDGKIIVEEGAGSGVNLSSDRVIIENLIFTNNSVVGGISSVSFSFSVSYRSDSKTTEYQYSKDFFGTANLNIK